MLATRLHSRTARTGSSGSNTAGVRRIIYIIYTRQSTKIVIHYLYLIQLGTNLEPVTIILMPDNAEDLGAIHKLVNSNGFNIGVSILVSVNAITIGIETDRKDASADEAWTSEGGDQYEKRLP